MSDTARHFQATPAAHRGKPPIPFYVEDQHGAKERFVARPSLPGTILFNHDAILAGAYPTAVKGGAMIELIDIALRGVYARWEFDAEKQEEVPVLEPPPDPNDKDDKREDEFTRFRTFADDPDRGIDGPVIAAIWRFLVESYSNRPTQPPSPSGPGRSSTENGSTES